MIASKHSGHNVLDFARDTRAVSFVDGCGIPQENAAVAALLFMKRLTVAVGVLN